MLHNIYDDKRAQEQILRSSNLDWTIVRPGRLTNGIDRRRAIASLEGPLPGVRASFAWRCTSSSPPGGDGTAYSRSAATKLVSYLLDALLPESSSDDGAGSTIERLDTLIQAGGIDDADAGRATLETG